MTGFATGPRTPVQEDRWYATGIAALLQVQAVAPVYRQAVPGVGLDGWIGCWGYGGHGSLNGTGCVQNIRTEKSGKFTLIVSGGVP